MQAWLGSPIGRTPSGSTTVFVDTDVDGSYLQEYLVGTTTYYSILAWSYEGASERWRNGWPMFIITEPTDAGAASYFGLARSKQFLLVEWTEDYTPDLTPESIEVRTAPGSGVPGDAMAFYAASTSTGVTYASSPFVASQRTEISANVATWLGGGLPGNSLLAFYATDPFPHIEADPGTPEIYYHWWSLLAAPAPGTVADAPIIFWGVDE